MTDKERDELLLDMSGDMKAIRQRVDEHHAALFGNGHPGLKDDVRRLDQTHATCPAQRMLSAEERSLRQQSRGNRLAIIALVVAGLSSVGGIFGPLIKWLAPLLQGP